MRRAIAERLQRHSITSVLIYFLIYLGLARERRSLFHNYAYRLRIWRVASLFHFL